MKKHLPSSTFLMLVSLLALVVIQDQTRRLEISALRNIAWAENERLRMLFVQQGEVVSSGLDAMTKLNISTMNAVSEVSTSSQKEIKEALQLQLLAVSNLESRIAGQGWYQTNLAAVEPLKARPAFETGKPTGTVTEKNNSWWRWAYRVPVRNNTANSVTYAFEVQFLDAKGYVIDTRTERVSLAAFESKTVIGSSLVDLPSATRVQSLSLKLSR